MIRAERKARAARQNGQKGGRPRKVTMDEVMRDASDGAARVVAQAYLGAIKDEPKPAKKAKKK